VACFATSPEVFNSLAEKENPQGILAVCASGARLDQLNRSISLGVALVSPQIPEPGAILRTVDAVGATG